MTIKQETVFTTSDGVQFPNLPAAERHEREIKKAAEDKYTKYLGSIYSGRRLLEKHSLTERGEWEVRGEDGNADIGGSHRQPYLGTFSGTLETVVRHAVNLPGFWTWGEGGDIRKIVIVKLPVVTKLD